MAEPAAAASVEQVALAAAVAAAVLVAVVRVAAAKFELLVAVGTVVEVLTW